MADQLLSINDSSLTAIATAIRNKGGTNSPLEFPSDFVDALQNIETVATVTPKIAPYNTYLDSSGTSHSIQAGFHDGTGTIYIQTEQGSANPKDTQETYYPSTGKFFSSFTVGGTGNGVVIATGDTTLSGTNSVTVSGLSFTPYGMILAMKTPNSASYLYTGFVWDKDLSNNTTVPLPYTRNGKAGGVKVATQMTRQYGSITIGGSYNSSYFNGTYSYVVWGA